MKSALAGRYAGFLGGGAKRILGVYARPMAVDYLEAGLDGIPVTRPPFIRP